MMSIFKYVRDKSYVIQTCWLTVDICISIAYDPKEFELFMYCDRHEVSYYKSTGIKNEITLLKVLKRKYNEIF